MNKPLVGFIVILIALLTGFLLSCSDDDTSSPDTPLTLTFILYIDSGTDGDWFTSDDTAFFCQEIEYYSKNIALSIINMEKRALRDSLLTFEPDPWEWNIKSTRRSDDIGVDEQWLTSDDTYSYITISTRDGDLINNFIYDPSVYPPLNITDRIVYTLSDNKLIKILNYSGTGADGIWDTTDDNTSSGSSHLYSWDSGSRIERIREYFGDESAFLNVIVIAYDVQGRLDAITRYSDIDETIIASGYDFEYSSDGNTLEVWTKDAGWNTTGRRTYQNISSEEIRITLYSDAGADSDWGTSDDVVSGIQSRTFSNGLPDEMIWYQADGATVNSYATYSY